MSTRKERKLRYKRRLCPNCGEKGPHFIPSAFGDQGRYICEPKKIEVKK